MLSGPSHIRKRVVVDLLRGRVEAAAAGGGGGGERRQTMASGGTAPQFKFFFFAQPAHDKTKHFLMEMLLNTGTNTAQITIKSDAAPTLVAEFTELVKKTLRSVH